MSDRVPTPFEELCWAHLAGARWYAGKGRPARLALVLPLPEPTTNPSLRQVRTFIAKVVYTDTGEDTAHHWYQLVFCLFAEDEAADAEVLGVVDVPDAGRFQVVDASRSATGQRVLLRKLLGGEGVATGPQRHQQVVLEPQELSPDLPPRAFGGEQSNTSIMYGSQAMLKLFRRLELGRNLDIEVHDALAHKVGASAAVAHLYGWSEAAWADADGTQCQADLSMLVEQFRDAADGWELAVSAAVTGEDFAPEAARLGHALRQIHLNLADAFGTHEIDGTRIAQQMADRLDAALPVVPELAAHAEGLRHTFAGIAGLRIPAQRVHGDFHLGQTLTSSDASGHRTWKIIDFEGEPLKTLIERLMPDTPWRDVAGMLRSFDYAAATAMEKGVDADAVRRWAQAASDAFVGSYLDDSRRCSANDEAVLRAYMADKAVYETVYEARNRPHWLTIPLSALAQLAEHEQNRNSTLKLLDNVEHPKKMEAES